VSDGLWAGQPSGTSEGQGNWSSAHERERWLGVGRLSGALASVARTVSERDEVEAPLKRELVRLVEALERAPLPDAEEVADVDQALADLGDPAPRVPATKDPSIDSGDPSIDSGPEIARLMAVELAISGLSASEVRRQLRAAIPRKQADELVRSVMGSMRRPACAPAPPGA
jgi:hypothetical protein